MKSFLEGGARVYPRSKVFRVIYRVMGWLGMCLDFNEMKGKTSYDPAFQSKHVRKSLGLTFSPQ
jgi:hypothetical protein